MNINQVLVQALPPVAYEDPRPEMLDQVRLAFPLLASLLKDSPTDPVVQGIVAGLLSIYAKADELGLDMSAFDDLVTWDTALKEADDLVHSDTTGVVETLRPMYPHMVEACVSHENSGYGAGVLLAWLTAHDENSTVATIEQDDGIPEDALRILEQLDVPEPVVKEIASPKEQRTLSGMMADGVASLGAIKRAMDSAQGVTFYIEGGSPYFELAFPDGIDSSIFKAVSVSNEVSCSIRAMNNVPVIRIGL